MRNLLFVLLTLVAFYSFSQKKATTESGKKVILFDDGTWEYAKPDAKLGQMASIPSYSKKASSSKLIKGKKVKYGIYFNATKWKVNDQSGNDDAEYAFNLKGEDCYAIVIPERIEIPLETLKEIALDNAREAAPDTKITKSGYVKVNGKKVFMMQMEGTIKGISFVYLGYYYSGKQGSIQFINLSSI